VIPSRMPIPIDLTPGTLRTPTPALTAYQAALCVPACPSCGHATSRVRGYQAVRSCPHCHALSLVVWTRDENGSDIWAVVPRPDPKRIAL